MSDPPAWAAFFSRSAYRHFRRCLEVELQGRGLAYEIGDGQLVLRDRGIAIGLVNLAQRCHASVPPRWPEHVRFLLDQIEAVAAQDEVVRALTADPAGGRERLRAQIQSHEYLREVPREGFVIERCNEDLAIVLVWDLPTTVALVSRADIASWGLSDAELLVIGLENVRTLEPFERRALEVEGAYELAGPSHFVASHALALHEEEGALIWVPNRHTLLCAPGALPEAAAALAPIAARRFRDGPGSLSPHPYRCHLGRPGARA